MFGHNTPKADIEKLEHLGKEHVYQCLIQVWPPTMYIYMCVCDYVCTKNTYVCILYKCMRVQKERFFIGTTYTYVSIYIY